MPETVESVLDRSEAVYREGTLRRKRLSSDDEDMWVEMLKVQTKGAATRVCRRRTKPSNPTTV